jgi:hypothetical protein
MIDQPQGEKPALTVVIQSWWTPALAVLMLVVGLLAGYFGRPLLNNSPTSDGIVAAVKTSVPTIPANQAAVPTTTVDPTIAAISSKEQFMAYIISQTRHFQGDPNATVTLIEFSDFQ